MLLWNGTEFVQFVGSKIVSQSGNHPVEPSDLTMMVPCVRTEPLDNVDRVSSKVEGFLTVLHDFLDDPTATYVGGNAARWRMALDHAAGGVL